MTLTCGPHGVPTVSRYTGQSYHDLLDMWVRCIHERRAEVYWFEEFPLFRRSGGGLNGEDTWIFALSHPRTPESAKVELAWDDHGVPVPYPDGFRIWKRDGNGVEHRTVGNLGDVAALLDTWHGIGASLDTDTADSTLDMFAL